MNNGNRPGFDGNGGNRPNGGRGFGGNSGNRPNENRGFGGSNSNRPNENRGFGGNSSNRSNENRGFGGNSSNRSNENRGFGGNSSNRPAGNRSFGGNNANRPNENRGFGGNSDNRPNDNRGFGGNNTTRPANNRSFGGERRDMPRENQPRDGRSMTPEGQNRPVGGTRPYSPAPKADHPVRSGDKRPFDGAKKPYSGAHGQFRAKPAPTGTHGAGKRPYPAKRPTPYAPARSVAPAVPVSDGMPARRLALEVIRAVTENNAYASLTLDEKLNRCALPLVDRRLAARLVYDTLEHMLTLDYALNSLMARPDTDIKLRNILRLGACQILLEDRIPESAACNTSVTLCKELGMEGLAGVCNGILRNLVRQKDAIVYPDPEVEPIKSLSIRNSVPEWLVERLLDDWDADAERLISYHQPNAPVTIRPNMMRMDAASFEEFLRSKVWDWEKGSLPFSWHVRNMAEIAHDAGFVGGKFSIQSESSMMVCLAAAPKNGMQILDACAAPGGKSCLLAEMMQGTGRVQAWELHPHRTDLIAAQVKRLDLENVRPMTRDALKPREDLIETMDIVLLDAPCSGLGVMSEKPDVRYRVTPESVSELVTLQSNLLDAVCPYVKKGGTLVYSTCSVLKDENERQAEQFLARHPEFEVQRLPDTIPEKYRQYEQLGLQLLPNRDGVEGFYMCRMRRKRV